MATKLRLILDFILQTAIFIGFALRFYFLPEEAWQTLGYLAICISSWQILHALYVVRKYQDWRQRLYLRNMRQLLAYIVFTLLIGGFMLVASFGLLMPFFIFTLDVLYAVACCVVLMFALLYFAQSLRYLYDYSQRPRSFWDL